VRPAFAIRPLVLLLLSCAVWTVSLRAEAAPPFRLVGYVMAKTDIPRIPAGLLTHLDFAFAHIDAAGRVVLDGPNDERALGELVALKAINPTLRIILSIGGWGADGFSDAALTEASRARFSATAVALVERHRLDGLDIDWEYPGQPGPGIRFRPEDRRNFTPLLAQLRRDLDALSEKRHAHGGDRCVLTIATTGGVYFEHTEMDRLHPLVDWMNVMSYDLYGSFSTTTGHHAGLFATTDAPAGAPTTERLIRQHLAAGIPREKLLVGAAFYGRSWTGVKPDASGSPLLAPYAQPGPSHSYREIARDYLGRPDFERRWDTTAQAVTLWQPSTGTLISYEDADALRAKANFVRQEQLGGIMYWEQSDDPQAVLLSAAAQALR